jgi:1,4-dihydroxy-2-naphthoyl-CoA hydrolase
MIDTSLTLELLNNSGENTLSDNLGIQYTRIEEEELEAEMPIDKRTVQQLGMMHGGASAALAEMVGSMAAYLSIDRENYFCVGQEIKTNHLKAVMGGKVKAIAKALHIGFQSHVWQIKTYDNQGELVAFSTLTMAILPMDKKMKMLIGDIFKKSSD